MHTECIPNVNREQKGDSARTERDEQECGEHRTRRRSIPLSSDDEEFDDESFDEASSDVAYQPTLQGRTKKRRLREEEKSEVATSTTSSSGTADVFDSSSGEDSGAAPKPPKKRRRLNSPKRGTSSSVDACDDSSSDEECPVTAEPPRKRRETKESRRGKAAKSDAFRLFKLRSAWTDDELEHVHTLLLQFTTKLNRVLEEVSKGGRPGVGNDLGQWANFRFRCEGRAALLLYLKGQKKHIDAKSLMDAGDPSRTALWMLNLFVNALGVTWDAETNQCTVQRSERKDGKFLCLDSSGTRNCTNARGKHLLCRDYTVVVSKLPDLATAMHHVHHVSNWTSVFTNRELSQKVKDSAVDVEKLVGKLPKLKDFW